VDLFGRSWRLPDRHPALPQSAVSRQRSAFSSGRSVCALADGSRLGSRARCFADILTVSSHGARPPVTRYEKVVEALGGHGE